MIQIDNENSSKFIQIPIAKISAEDLIQQLSDERLQLRQVIDEMANTLAMQKELIQQLRNEIARLKGQKPKPDIKPSKLEGQNRKPDWHKRIGPHNGQRKTILFSLWVYVESLQRLPVRSTFSAITTATLTLRTRSLNISRLARQVIKKVRRIGKPGQPKRALAVASDPPCIPPSILDYSSIPCGVCNISQSA